ncbi:MAG: dienelactone hydrolase family protein [Verrucomicrobiaceae bacterium]
MKSRHRIWVILLIGITGLCQAEDKPRVALTFGSPGDGPGQLKSPIGIAISKRDVVYIAEFNNSRVHKFSTEGKVLGHFACVKNASGIAVDTDEHLYVSSMTAHEVCVYDSGGKELRKIGTKGAGEGQIDQPGGLVIGPDGVLYIADQGNHRVQRFTLDGKFLSAWGGHGKEPGKFGGGVKFGSRFGGPHFIAFDHAGNLFTTESNDGRVQKLTPDGKPLMAFGSNQVEPGGFGGRRTDIGNALIGPIGVLVDRKDRIWVSATNSLVQVFSLDGKFLFALNDKEGPEPGRFHLPHAMAEDSKGDVYVVDSSNQRVQKYILSPELAVKGEPLAGTKPLEWPEADLSARLMDGAHVFVERKIDESVAKRGVPDRERFKTMIGAVDARLPAAMERYGDDKAPALVAETAKYHVHQVRWPVFEGLWGCGLLIEPVANAVAHVVWIPDADTTPEKMMAHEGVRRLAENGCMVIIPVTISREKMKDVDQTHREWIYRQAYHMGRHVIGYEVQTAMAAIDWLHQKHGDKAKIGVCGHTEGGLVAFYTAACDTRVNASLVSGHFDNRQHTWAEPLYRNLFGLLHDFGDAEIASLIQPRGLVIEHSKTTRVTMFTAQKGAVRQPALADVKAEVARIKGEPKPVLIEGTDSIPVAPFSENALLAFAKQLGIGTLAPVSKELPKDKRTGFDPATRHERYFREMEQHVQRLVQQSEHVRDDAFLFKVMPELANNKWSTDPQHPTQSMEKFVAGAKPFREQFAIEGMGRFEEALLPPNARTRKLKETDKWTAYDVVLDVYPELFAWGVLVLPKNLKEDERRPVVVCQHGRNGLPRDMLDTNSTAYGNVAAKLAERGFIAFAPHNLYRGEDRYRWLCRKANTVKATLFSFIIPSHDQILRWLGEQPFVDPKRIAFYGLSYGGESAVRIPTILEGYCLSICSGDFNQWTRKVASTTEPFSFMRTIEWEMSYWNLGHTFDYAEMTYLMLPRPFMVERGHLDRVGRDQWVAHEYAKVRWLYSQLGIPDRTQIEFFQGGHSMRAEGTFDFLHQHLNWPKP